MLKTVADRLINRPFKTSKLVPYGKIK